MQTGMAAPTADRQTQMRYSTKAQTVESTEPSTIVQIALTGLVGTQALVSMVMMGMGVYFFVQCDPGVGSQYSGVTPVAAAIFLLESMLTCFIHFCCVMRLLSLGVSVLCFLTASVILVLEIASYKCV
uniref:Uncharacterized protein n=1 Tax=Romanomermis culicivorax TaxID=13658 RepID=A0A915HSY6_ROMCU